MNKEERELREAIKEKQSEIRQAIEADDLDKGESLGTELEKLERKLSLIRSASKELPEIKKEEERKSPKNEREIRDLSFEELDQEYEGTFLRAFRGQRLSQRDKDVYDRLVELRDVPTATPYLQTAVDEDGGFIVPKSVSTKINEYKRQGEYDLTQLVDVEYTAVMEGSFTYEKLGTITPWENVSQWETIGEVEAPQFERKSYKIEDYAGILPLPRTLLQDTDQNLLNHIAKYIAKKSTVTRNAKILAVVNATYTTKKAVATTDDIKDILDIELDPAFNPAAKIVTNQYGYNFLRKLKDADGNYLMQPDVTQPDKKVIDGKAVEVLPERTLKNVDGNAPIFIGQFKEAIRFYDRGVYEVTPTTIGGDAFKRNSYDIRVIDRFDAIALDPEAVIAGEITLPTTP